MWNRLELKASGLSNFKRNYGQAVLVALVSALTMIRFTRQIEWGDRFFMGSHNFLQSNYWFGELISEGNFLGTAAMLLDIFLLQILLIGTVRFFVENRDYDASVSKVLFGFQNGFYANMVVVTFLQKLFIGFWSLLLVIPGIVKSYEYRMIPYILAEQPDISYKDAFRISKEMMYGEKWETFVLDLSFIGWYFLSMFTCGILSVLYVRPYQLSTNAELYVVLRDKWFAENGQQNNRTWDN